MSFVSCVLCPTPFLSRRARCRRHIKGKHGTNTRVSYDSPARRHLAKGFALPRNCRRCCVQFANRIACRSIAIVVALLIPSFLFFHFRDSLPIGQYRDYAPSEAITPVKTNNDVHQPGYFKGQPEWDWDVPEDASWKGYARKPQNNQVVLLTASDGLGHNSAVPNILERVLDDREKYCERHGYTNLWLNTSRYDIGTAHKAS